MWTRNVLILAGCLVPSSVLAVQGSAPGYAEVIPTPASSSPQTAAFVERCVAPCPPRTAPWYYWWLSYRGRGQHYAYPPPLPGWYYFRPYSVGQLRAQQEMVLEWGGDARDPYSNSVFQQVYPKYKAPPVPADK